MKFRHIICISIVVCIALCELSFATNKGVAVREAVAVTAEVVEIDYETRDIALLGPEGNILELTVGPEARNFDQIQVGDKVKATYLESIALFLGTNGEMPSSSAEMTAARSAKGEMPAGAIVETVDISAEVVEIDIENRTVTLKLPNGETTSKKVDPSVKAFDSLKKGDVIQVRYTEAVALSVERP